MRWSLVLVASFVLTSLACGHEPANDWPRWRGPNADGIADERKVPIRWSQTENIRWSVKLPGWGTSSPVVHGDRVFVTSHLKDKKSLLTLCFDRNSGQELWRHDFGFGVDQHTHEKSNLAVNTPAATEEAVYGNVVTGYTGTVRFSSRDNRATLPANYTFTPANSGVHTFTGLILRKKGMQTITITDTHNSALTGSDIVDVL
jgi:hypothetical protein